VENSCSGTPGAFGNYIAGGSSRRKLIRRKKPEVGPLENEARFRAFFERSADAMSLLDPQTLRYIEANEAVAKLFGAPDREALRNVSPTERWPERQPDGRLSGRT
jgi:PAS domain-containing protein